MQGDFQEKNYIEAYLLWGGCLRSAGDDNSWLWLKERISGYNRQLRLDFFLPVFFYFIQFAEFYQIDLCLFFVVDYGLDIADWIGDAIIHKYKSKHQGQY